MSLRTGAGIQERLRKAGLGMGVPFEFVRLHPAISFLDIIDLLLCMCTPEVAVAIDLPIGQVFDPFTHDKIFLEAPMSFASSSASRLFTDVAMADSQLTASRPLRYAEQSGSSLGAVWERVCSGRRRSKYPD